MRNTQQLMRVSECVQSLPHSHWSLCVCSLAENHSLDSVCVHWLADRKEYNVDIICTHNIFIFFYLGLQSILRMFRMYIRIQCVYKYGNICIMVLYINYIVYVCIVVEVVIHNLCACLCDGVNTAVSSFSDVMKLKTLKGLALQDILTDIHGYIHRGSTAQSVAFNLRDEAIDLCACKQILARDIIYICTVQLVY